MSKKTKEFRWLISRHPPEKLRLGYFCGLSLCSVEPWGLCSLLYNNVTEQALKAILAAVPLPVEEEAIVPINDEPLQPPTKPGCAPVAVQHELFPADEDPS